MRFVSLLGQTETAQLTSNEQRTNQNQRKISIAAGHIAIKSLHVCCVRKIQVNWRFHSPNWLPIKQVHTIPVCDAVYSRRRRGFVNAAANDVGHRDVLNAMECAKWLMWCHHWDVTHTLRCVYVCCPSGRWAGTDSTALSNSMLLTLKIRKGSHEFPQMGGCQSASANECSVPNAQKESNCIVFNANYSSNNSHSRMRCDMVWPLPWLELSSCFDWMEY